MNRTIRHLLVVAAVAAVDTLFGASGCAMTGAPYGGGPATGGWVYTSVTMPSTNLSVTATDATAKPTKRDRLRELIGIVGTGDASLQAAMKVASPRSMTPPPR